MKYNEEQIIREAVDFLIDGNPVLPNEQGRSAIDAFNDVTSSGMFVALELTQKEFGNMVNRLTKPLIEAFHAKIFAGRMEALEEAGWNLLDDSWLGGATGRNNLQISLQCDKAGIIETIEVTVDTMYVGKGEGLEEHELTGTKVEFDFEGFIPSPKQIKLDLIEKFTLSIPD